MSLDASIFIPQRKQVTSPPTLTAALSREEAARALTTPEASADVNNRFGENVLLRCSELNAGQKS